ncbi:hypothetical protein [Actinoplanes sp. GCM10030250]|uniref:hypothetical protein n=1 Tax=Actinoplanes sp. GCM10030250 TaxID=3273376 RepID=UPI0036164AFA
MDGRDRRRTSRQRRIKGVRVCMRIRTVREVRKPQVHPAAGLSPLLYRLDILAEQLSKRAEPPKRLVDKLQPWVVVLGGIAAIIAFTPDIVVKVRSVFPERTELSGQVQIMQAYVLPVGPGAEPNWDPPELELPGGNPSSREQPKNGEAKVSVSTTGLKGRTALLSVNAKCGHYVYRSNPNLGETWSPGNNKETTVHTLPLQGDDQSPPGFATPPVPATCSLTAALFFVEGTAPESELIQLAEAHMPVPVSRAPGASPSAKGGAK